MHYTTKISPLVRELELKHNPMIIRVNKFDEDSAKKFSQDIAAAHNSGQKVIPVVIDSYGGQVYSLMSMIGSDLRPQSKKTNFSVILVITPSIIFPSTRL